MSQATESPLIPDLAAMARELKQKRITPDNLTPGPGWVLCRIPELSSEIIIPGRRGGGGEDGMPPMMRPVEVVKIGQPPFSATLGKSLPEPWFKVGDMVYTSGSFIAGDGWEDDGLVIVARDHIFCRYKGKP